MCQQILMSITEATKNRLTEYITDRGHVIVDNETAVKTQSWVVECAKCEYHNEVRVNTLLSLLHTLNNLKCKSCKFQTKLNKFLERCKFDVVPHTIAQPGYAQLQCTICGLGYIYTGDYHDHFRCYCQMVIKRSEHVLYRNLSQHFEEYKPFMSREVVLHDNHKVDIQLVINDKVFLIEVDDPGHFNPRTTQGMRDIECVKQFIEEQRENQYLIHINEDDIFNPDSMGKLYDWIINTLQYEPVENLLLVDSSGKYRYKYLNIGDLAKYSLLHE